jgi:arsenate reductase (glutaredoxin)
MEKGIKMSACIIYHNPRCSKSRKALEILQNYHIMPIVIEYLKTPLNLEQLLQLRAHMDLKELVRSDEPLFKELQLSLDDEEKVLNAILEEPILLQRPIVIYNGKAIIARPPEKILELLFENMR